MTRQVASRLWLSVAVLVLLPSCAAPTRGSNFVRPEWARPLGPAEQATAEKHGVVLGPAASAPSYHLGYTALFKAHKPAYFTADAMLHAVHRSFDLILASIERSALRHDLHTLLAELRDGLAKQSEGSLAARAGADLYLAVAASLLDGRVVGPRAGADAAAITELTAAAVAATGETSFELFGKRMQLDWSMFKPRGHYAGAKDLERYFRAMMWLGRVEIRIARRDDQDATWTVNRDALEATLLISAALTPRANEAWRQIDQASNILVGPPDSMSFPGVGRALATMGSSLATIREQPDAAVITAFRPQAEQKIGTQMLRRGVKHIAFLPLGQRYLFDSHVLSAVTYGQLPVKRMMPSPLDIGHAVFRNRAATQLLGPDFSQYDYREALDAIADRGDQMGDELWSTSVTHVWLQALRELSPDETRDASLPAVMKTPQWHRRMLNTQLASWAELRHDILLYAKQSVTAMAICGFPDAYVEPYPRFFEKIAALADRNLALVRSLKFREETNLKARMITYFEGARGTMLRLAAIAETERQGLPVTAEQLDFLNHAVSVDGRSAGCTTVYEPKGWYAELYFERQHAMSARPIVADVHTQPTDAQGNIVGKVLHVGTGAPRLMHVAIQTRQGKRSYRGFVASYYEHVTRDFERLTDEDWNRQLRDAPPPDVPWLADIAPSR